MPKKEIVYTNKEDIIHYRAQKESFYREYETYHINANIADVPALIDEDNNAFNIKSKSDSKTLESADIDHDEFIAGMEDNSVMGVKRDTILVTEDINTKNISFKKFRFEKRMVNPINRKTGVQSERRYFKVMLSTLYSLTINKETGDFTVYFRSKEKNMQRFFLRKNISGNKVKETLSGMVRMGDMPMETEEAMGIFYNLLGYDPIFKQVDFIERYFDDVVFPLKDNRTSLIIMPFYNYLKKLNFQYKGYSEFHTLEFMFKRDKNKFRNGTSADFYNHYFKLKNKYIGEAISQKLYETTDIHIFRYNHQQDVAKKSNAHWSLYFPQTPNHLVLWLCDKFGATNDMIDNIDILSDTTTLMVDGIPAFTKEIIDIYKFDVFDMAMAAKSNERFYKTFKELKFFQYFGIKLNIDSMVDYDQRSKTFENLYDCLAYTRIRSGTVQVNQEFYELMKSTLPEFTTISVLNYKMLRNRLLFEYDVNEQGWDTKVKLMKYPWHVMLPYFTVTQGETTNKIRLNIYNDASDGAGYYSGNGIGETKIAGLETILYDEVHFLSKLKIKQIYSKQLFEKFYAEKFSNEPNLLYEFLW